LLNAEESAGLEQQQDGRGGDRPFSPASLFTWRGAVKLVTVAVAFMISFVVGR
jgi:hypothetical protein